MGGFESVVTPDTCHCLICGSPNVVMHHLISGTSGRKLADQDKLVVPLCPKHHNMEAFTEAMKTAGFGEEAEEPPKSGGKKTKAATE